MRFAVWNPILQTYSFHEAVLTQREEVVFRPIERTLKGFIARIWDHEIRHLDGILPFAEEISHREIYVSEDFTETPGMH
jgi:peptide deformylase